MSPRVAAIVQARMGSSRLPGKVLLDICGQAMLTRVVARVQRARAVADVIVATTTDGADEILAAFCKERHIECKRGSQFDVLDRYFQSARAIKAEVIVRITADCPVIDPELIDKIVELVIGDPSISAIPAAKTEGPAIEFATNRLPPPWQRTYPIGLDIEVCTFDALARAWHAATEPQQREHVMPYFYEGAQLSWVGNQISVGTSPRGFRIALLDCEEDLGSFRWTVDTPQDLEFIRQVYGHFDGRDDFSWKEILELVRRRPELMQINAGVQHKTLGDVDSRAPRS
jgi:spore coat polysaccharide biosynthesis protein SpsF